MTEHDKLIPIMCLIVGFVVGFGVEKLLADRAMTNLKSRLVEFRLASVSPVSMTQLSGVIKSIDGKTLTITLLSPKDLFGPSSLDERRVTADDSTIITIESAKSPAAYEKEVAELREKAKLVNPGTPLVGVGAGVPPPLLTEKKESTFSALKVGQTVNIATAENVKTKKRFIASEISIYDFVMAFGPPAVRYDTINLPPQ